MTPRPQSPRQTLAFLRDLVQSQGLRPNFKLGQCFLIDLNFLEFIIRTSELTPADLIVEVGSGTGSLTTALAENAGAVLSVELDPAFHELAKRNTALFGNVTLLQGDILSGKNRLNENVLAELGRLQNNPQWTQLKLISNLPYVVATPVITNFLLTELRFERMVVTVQFELAERLVARPGTKEYGSLAVLVQSLADVELVRKMPPGLFWPRPSVDSALVLVKPSMAKRSRIPNLERFHRFCRDLYLHRRKNLRGALHAFCKDRFSKEELDRHLFAHGFDPAGRAELLSVEEHLTLCETMNPI
jgi:16S rRNA (adenine1518-N6/adenine1519-N6)-dimethyltransferase